MIRIIRGKIELEKNAATAVVFAVAAAAAAASATANNARTAIRYTAEERYTKRQIKMDIFIVEVHGISLNNCECADIGCIAYNVCR